MAKGLLINLDRCTGCDSCIVACKLENQLPLGSFYNKVIAIGPTGTFPDVEKYWLPSQCQQCENPHCVAVCPTGASYRDPKTGYVLIDKDKCIDVSTASTAAPTECARWTRSTVSHRNARSARKSPPTAAMFPPACTTATAVLASLAIMMIPTAMCVARWRSTRKIAFTRFPIRAMPSPSRATSCPRSSPAGRS